MGTLDGTFCSPFGSFNREPRHPGSKRLPLPSSDLKSARKRQRQARKR